MDQTINEMVYRGRISNTVEAWKKQEKRPTGGTIIASDGTSYKKEGKVLRQIITDPKLLKYLNNRLAPKLASDGLVRSADAVACKDTVADNVADLVAEI